MTEKIYDNNILFKISSEEKKEFARAARLSGYDSVAEYIRDMHREQVALLRKEKIM